jgi:hypothetical protein
MSRTRLPDRRGARIMTFQHDGRTYRATSGSLANGVLGEVFLDIDRPDSTLQQHADDSAVLVSLLLQNNVAPAVIRRSISGPGRRWIGSLAVPGGGRMSTPPRKATPQN